MLWGSEEYDPGRRQSEHGKGTDNILLILRASSYGPIERKDKSDWVSACRELQVERTKGRGRKTWNECVKVDMKWLNLPMDNQYS